MAVGTPGRLCSLLQTGALPPRSISTLVLDEADTLLSEAFYSDVTWVYDQLPKRKQVGGRGRTSTHQCRQAKAIDHNVDWSWDFTHNNAIPNRSWLSPPPTPRISSPTLSR